MQFPESWLREFCNPPLTTRQLADTLTMGGMEVEEIAERDPSAIVRLHVDPLLGFSDFHGRRLAYEAGIAEDVAVPVITAALYARFASRIDESFAAKITAALRNEFGGHAVRSE